MSKTEVGYLLGAAFVFWWFGIRSDRLGRELEHLSSRRDMAELLGKTDHANKLRQEWEQVEKEHKKAVRREVFSFWGIVGAAAVPGWLAAILSYSASKSFAGLVEYTCPHSCGHIFSSQLSPASAGLFVAGVRAARTFLRVVPQPV